MKMKQLDKLSIIDIYRDHHKESIFDSYSTTESNPARLLALVSLPVFYKDFYRI